MWAPVAQLQSWLAAPLSLPKWVTLDNFEMVPQDYKGGNVMVEEPPISFSLFVSTIDYSLFSHLPFEDFIALAFPDIARDLDIPI